MKSDKNGGGQRAEAQADRARQEAEQRQRGRIPPEIYNMGGTNHAS